MNAVEEKATTVREDDQFDDTITVTGLFARAMTVADPRQLQLTARTAAGEYDVRVFATRPGRWVYCTVGPDRITILGSGMEYEGDIKDGAFVALLDILSDTKRREELS